MRGPHPAHLLAALPWIASQPRKKPKQQRAAMSMSHTWDQQRRETLPRIILTFNISGSGLSVKWLLLAFLGHVTLTKADPDQNNPYAQRAGLAFYFNELSVAEEKDA